MDPTQLDLLSRFPAERRAFSLVAGRAKQFAKDNTFSLGGANESAFGRRQRSAGGCTHLLRSMAPVVRALSYP